MRSRIGMRILFGFVLLLIVLFIVEQPTQASDTTTGIAAWLTSAADSFGTFLSNVFTQA